MRDQAGNAVEVFVDSCAKTAAQEVTIYAKLCIINETEQQLNYFYDKSSVAKGLERSQAANMTGRFVPLARSKQWTDVTIASDVRIPTPMNNICR